ncbi:hypothetical protein G7Y89_g13554 [Cudoniella acicularis]|uniref:SAP domain-containing protein n=1 Tax=Cudoniella acicularis TaxID=354080 RepID=A0A8H4R6P0_9HELO|nr:hypothetical protein G7Y89_g13554 [Cudoniella acicularis]
MTDWNKLKVVDLKAELKKRGLGQTGPKATLVARLIEAENEDGSESEATVQGDAGKLDASAATSPDTVSPTQQSTDISAEIDAHAPLQIASESQDEAPEKPMPPPPPIVAETPKVESRAEVETIETSRSSTQPKDDHHSALPSAEPQEILDDRSKRKRRSQSPTPSGTDSARKRIKNQDERIQGADDVVTSKEDASWVEKHNATSAAEVNKAAKQEVPSGDNEGPAPIIADVAKMDVVIEDIAVPEQGVSGGMDVDMQKSPKPVIDPAGNSPLQPRNSKFKGLFTPQPTPAMENSASRDSVPDAMEVEPDHIISPAIHPATSALYIRDFMRPLNPLQLKSHLAELAAPPGRSPNPDVIANFYLDPIRTHAFIALTSVSAASRVRSAIHDRIWPDEQTRKPLWADFIPAEKVKEWIEEEEASNSGGRASSKRWEVYYDVDEDRNVTAQLQEVSGFSRPQPVRKPSIPIQPPQAPGRGIEGAPLGPRATQNRQQRTASTFSTLDQLFKCTTAKPSLYWKPVDKSLADKRLDNIDNATSKDAVGRRVGGEINRYTFEDGDVLVDRGPEIFPGIRPPPGHPGPRGGGPRGGGFRGGYARGPERVYDRYRNDRRDPRDDRRY